MVSRSRALLVRWVAVVLLLWVGGDLGAHGMFASDFRPIASGQVTVTGSRYASTGEAGPDHCFCHSLSLTATLPPPGATLHPGAPASICGVAKPPTGSRPALERPPQFLS
jgi:hypothetical protein